MKFSSSAVLSAVLFAPGAAAFTTSLPSVGPATVRQSGGGLFSTTEETEVTEEQERRRTKKDERLRMMKSLPHFYAYHARVAHRKAIARSRQHNATAS